MSIHTCPPPAQVRIITPQGDEGLFDFLIVSTGLLTDARLRPELSAFAEQVWTTVVRISVEVWDGEITPSHPLAIHTLN